MAADAIIVGGGIGGLTAALALARHGHPVTVYEQAPEFSDVGAGVQLSPNASRVLIDLGLESALAATGFLPENIEMRDWRTGAVLGASPLGAAAVEAFGAPYYHVHRADLLGALVEAARGCESIELIAGARIESVSQIGDQVAVQGPDIQARASVLVGADGIHSRVRRELFGSEAPAFTGNVAWRVLVPVERLPRQLIRPASTAWWGPRAHFVHYYVRGGALVNCVCVVERGDWREETWTARGEHAELKADFAGWHADLQTLLDAADPDTCYRWALFDRPPMRNWSRGAITLLGDACHPTLPFLAQGAAMAIEDAAVLSRALHAEANVERALAMYEATRRARTGRIQAGSRRNARIFHLSGVAAWLRNQVVGRAANSAFDWLYAYDPLTVPLEHP